MACGQGRRFSEQQISKIRHLLAHTDMTVPDIARRMGCSEGPVRSINRQFEIRFYNGRRAEWETFVTHQDPHPLDPPQKPAITIES
jgi:hypothetical protein